MHALQESGDTYSMPTGPVNSITEASGQESVAYDPAVNLEENGTDQDQQFKSSVTYDISVDENCEETYLND